MRPDVWEAVKVPEDGLMVGVMGALDWLTDGFGLDRWDAYHLMSQTGSLMIGGLGIPPHAVAARIPIAVLPPTVRALSGWPAAESSR